MILPPSSTLPRYVVHVHVVDGQRSTILRALPDNLLREDEKPPPISIPALPKPGMTLRPSVGAFESLGRHANPAFYFFGNAAPVYVLPGTKQTADVLLLAAGDLRSILYSIARGVHMKRLSLNVTFNDCCTAITARNIVLLYMLYDRNVTTEVVLDVWFALQLSAEAYIALSDALLALTGQDRDAVLQSLNVSFKTTYDKAVVLHYLSQLPEWQTQLTWERVKTMRKSAMSSLGRNCRGKG